MKKPTGSSLPFAVAVLVTASTVVVDLAIGNRLWAWYGSVGVAWLAAAWWLDHRLAWHLPRRVLWWACIPLAMHYVGGSLSGVHRLGGPNGMYWAFPWWDNLVHFLGCGAVAVLAAHVLASRPAGRLGGRATTIVLATATATTLGVFVELYEFVGFAWFGTIDQGYYTNTMLDLYYNLLGAATFAWAATRRA